MLKWENAGENLKVSMSKYHELDAIRYVVDRTGVNEIEIGKATKNEVPKGKKLEDWPPKPEKWWEDET